MCVIKVKEKVHRRKKEDEIKKIEDRSCIYVEKIIIKPGFLVCSLKYDGLGQFRKFFVIKQKYISTPLFEFILRPLHRRRSRLLRFL
jgi:hypothetical protein